MSKCQRADGQNKQDAAEEQREKSEENEREWGKNFMVHIGCTISWYTFSRGSYAASAFNLADKRNCERSTFLTHRPTDRGRSVLTSNYQHYKFYYRDSRVNSLAASSMHLIPRWIAKRLYYIITANNNCLTWLSLRASSLVEASVLKFIDTTIYNRRFINKNSHLCE